MDDDFNATLRRAAGFVPPPAPTTVELREATAALDAAEAAGDELQVQMANERLDRAFDAVRAAGRPAAPDFDAGVRGSVPAAPPGMNELLRADRFGVDGAQLPPSMKD